MEKLLEIMKEMKPGIDFMKEDNLVENGIFDSFGFITLVGEICDEFDVEISPLDIVPENFKSINTIYDLIERLQNEE